MPRNYETPTFTQKTLENQAKSFKASPDRVIDDSDHYSALAKQRTEERDQNIRSHTDSIYDYNK
jgi:hypothetical protein